MYSKSSPYAKTYVVGDYLDIMAPRAVIQDSSDETYTIESQYHMRPDLLAYQKYGSSKYWWMFAMRNKDTLIDPIQDFKAGITIKIPKIENLR